MQEEISKKDEENKNTHLELENIRFQLKNERERSTFLQRKLNEEQLSNNNNNNNNNNSPFNLNAGSFATGASQIEARNLHNPQPSLFDEQQLTESERGRFLRLLDEERAKTNEALQKISELQRENEALKERIDSLLKGGQTPQQNNQVYTSFSSYYLFSLFPDLKFNCFRILFLCTVVCLFNVTNLSILFRQFIRMMFLNYI